MSRVGMTLKNDKEHFFPTRETIKKNPGYIFNHWWNLLHWISIKYRLRLKCRFSRNRSSRLKKIDQNVESPFKRLLDRTGYFGTPCIFVWNRYVCRILYTVVFIVHRLVLNNSSATSQTVRRCRLSMIINTHLHENMDFVNFSPTIVNNFVNSLFYLYLQNVYASKK